MRPRFSLIKVNISDICLDLNNPRFEGFENQQECLEYMLYDKDTKLMNIIQDIAKNGLTLNPILITDCKGQNGYKYVVKDGNRRVATLKALSNPDSLPEKFKKNIKELSVTKEILAELQEIDCYYSPDIDAINFHIVRTHNGEMDGVGTKSWNAIAQYRNMHSVGGSHYLDKTMAIYDFLKSKDTHVETNNITNINRVFTKQITSELLGFSFDKDSNLIISEDTDSKILITILKQVFDDFGSDNPSKNVTDIEKVTDVENYLNELIAEHGDIKVKKDTMTESSPENANASPASEATSEKSSPSETEQQTGQENSKNPAPQISAKTGDSTRQKNPELRPKLWTSLSKYPIPKPDTVSVSGSKAFQVIKELRQLKPDSLPIASALLIRLLIEVGCHYYLEKTKFYTEKKNWNDISLADKISKIAEDMFTKGMIDKKEQQICEKMKDGNSLLSIDSLNKVVHATNFTLTGKEVIQFYDRYDFFIDHLYKE